jgi:hypothetical protein
MENLVYSGDFIIENLAPLSINNAYHTSSSHYKIKSADTQKWLFALKVQMRKYSNETDKIAKLFDCQKHYVAVRYVWFMPKSKLFTQEGPVSKKSIDISNWFKIPDDLIFGRSPHNPGAILPIDDGFICLEQGDKLPSLNDKYVLKLRVQIRKIDDLFVRAQKEWPLKDLTHVEEKF